MLDSGRMLLGGFSPYPCIPHFRDSLFACVRMDAEA